MRNISCCLFALSGSIVRHRELLAVPDARPPVDRLTWATNLFARRIGKQHCLVPLGTEEASEDNHFQDGDGSGDSGTSSVGEGVSRHADRESACALQRCKRIHAQIRFEHMYKRAALALFQSWH